VPHRAPVKIACQCHHEGFRTVEHRLVSGNLGHQRFSLASPIPSASADAFREPRPLRRTSRHTRRQRSERRRAASRRLSGVVISASVLAESPLARRSQKIAPGRPRGIDYILKLTARPE